MTLAPLGFDLEQIGEQSLAMLSLPSVKLIFVVVYANLAFLRELVRIYDGNWLYQKILSGLGRQTCKAGKVFKPRYSPKIIKFAIKFG